MSSDKKKNAVFNRPAPDALGLLLSRRSGSAKAMGKPGPSKKQLEQILEAGARAPDHGKLFPWRFIVFEGDGRKRAGDILAAAAKADGERDRQVEEERRRFTRAPAVIAVISAARVVMEQGPEADVAACFWRPKQVDSLPFFWKPYRNKAK